MNTTKKLLLLSIAFATMISCSSDDDSSTTDEADGIITSLTDVDYDATSLKGDIEGNITLAAGEYILDGALIVKSGYTLTIEAGTTFKATAGGTDVYLAVEQGAKIEAVGTATDPIVFTSNADTPASGDWGGILIIGYAPISGGGTATTEVVDFTYGGTDSTDNSGTLSYVTVKYTGATINSEKEFNGITFYAVGSGTTVNNIASFYGDDDAVEFFGGTVNVTNILVVNVKDDMFDYTQGYSGTITNAYGIRESGYTDASSDPRGIEGDGNFDGLSPDESGQSNPTFNDITIYSNSTAQITDIMKIRRSSSATITNAFVYLGSSAPTPGDFIDCYDSAGSSASDVTITVSGYGTNIDLTDNNYGSADPSPVFNITTATTVGGADSSVFSWTGYTFPTISVSAE
jgi:hypothetical protein